MEEEAASEAAEGVTHGTDSYVRISNEWCALKMLDKQFLPSVAGRVKKTDSSLILKKTDITR